MVAAMKKHYDFSKSVKNPYLSKAKKQLTIRLDEDTIRLDDINEGFNLIRGGGGLRTVIEY
jgi:Zn-dependent alcohol dehydrogenase